MSPNDNLELERLPWLRGQVPELREVIKASADSALFDQILDERTLDAPVRLKVVNKFSTAAWAYTKTPPMHNIIIGTGIVNNAKPGLSKESFSKFVRAYHRHEAGHARHSPRSQKETEKRILKPAGCEFSTYNYFEDARLEQLERIDTNEAFGWHEFEEFDAAAANFTPHNLFYLCIFVEGDRALLDKLLKDCKTPEDLDNVWQYWERAAACAQVDDLVPVIRDWMAEYGDFPESPKGCGLKGGLGMADNPQLLQDLDDADPVELQEEADQGESTEVLSDFEGTLPYEGKQLDLVVDLLRRQLRTRELRQSTHRAGKRLNHRAIAAELPLYRESKIEGQANRKKMTLLFDLSGSMEGDPCDAGVLFLAALSALADESLISGHVIFSKVNDNGGAVSEAYELPLSQQVLKRIVCDGTGEGLESAAFKHLQLLQDADWVGCYTDADLGDQPMNKAKLRSHGLYIHGLYVEPSMVSDAASHGVRERLLEHFDLAVVAPTVERLLQTLVIG